MMSDSPVVVIKIGSNVLMNEGLLDTSIIKNVVENIVYLKKQGYQCVVVSSGAVACGKEYLKTSCPESLDEVLFAQMCSSLGQPLLMKKYITEFLAHEIKAAQALLTQDAFTKSELKKSLEQVLLGLLELHVVPIINENDVISSEELVFSDNDMLAAHVAVLVKAEKLIILSNIDGLHTCHPDEGGELISEIDVVDDLIYEMASEKKSVLGRGGMKTKIQAADFVTQRGIEMFLGNGKEKDIVKKLFAEEGVGTHFLA